MKAPSAFFACLHRFLLVPIFVLLGTVAMARDNGSFVSAYTQPDNVPVDSGTTLSFPTTAVGETATMNFRVQSEKLGPVKMLAAYFDTAVGNWTEFSITGLFVGPNGTTLPNDTGNGEGLFCTVTFKPGSSGAKTGSFKIRTDQSTVTYVVNFTGSATSPSMQWQEPVGTSRNYTDLNVAFPLTFIGSSTPTKVIGIRNSGNGAATSAAVSITGPDASSFSVTPLTGATINAGETKTVTVTFNPTTAGNKSAQINFTRANIVSGSALTSLSLNGIASEQGPEIVVEEPAGTNRNSRDELAFGEGMAGLNTFSKTITIKNIGTQTLSGLSRSISGTNASEFSVSALTAGTTVAPGASISLQVSFTPTSAGSKSALLRIPNNDADENPFDLNLKASAIAPVMSMARTGVAVAASGQAVPGLSGVTYSDFFQVQTNSNGECAFYATLSNGGAVLMSNGGRGRTAAPVKVLAVGDDPAGGGGAISAFNLVCLQSDGTVNSVVTRGPATAPQPVTAVFRGSTQLFKLGDAPSAPIAGKTYSSIGPSKSLAVALSDGLGAFLADFDATETGATKATRFTNVYLFGNTTAPVSQQITSLLDTTFVSANRISQLSPAESFSALQANAPGTKTARTVLLFSRAGTKSTVFPTDSGDSVATGQPGNGGVFYSYSKVDPSYIFPTVPVLVKSDQANQMLDNVSYLNPGSWNLTMHSQAGRALPAIGRAMMSDSGSIYFEAPVFGSKAVPDKFVARSPRNGRTASDGKILLREGSLAPGLQRHSIKQLFYFTTSGLFVSGGGKCLIRATVQPDYGDTATKEVLYYNAEGTDTPVPIALAGDTISVGTGTKTITGFDVQSIWAKNVPNGPKPINDAGQVAVLVKCGTERVAYVFNAPQ